jgi:hypothetical protein
VHVCSFTFEFISLEQLREALAYFSQKPLPPNRRSSVPFEHYWQRWHERLPHRLHEESKRQKIVKAFHEALEKFEAEN